MFKHRGGFHLQGHYTTWARQRQAFFAFHWKSSQACKYFLELQLSAHPWPGRGDGSTARLTVKGAGEYPRVLRIRCAHP